MTLEKFTLEIRENCFLFVKIHKAPGRFVFYVLPYDKNLKGFFMGKTVGGKWEILYKVLVAKEVIQMEKLFAELIEEKIRELV